ncbi:MAG: Smr/MutS family protein [Firmicutes bacterium]|nr:Smr/MutS family protein [Bacillota bacterium]
METIDLHGLSLEEAKIRLEKRLLSAFHYGEKVVRIIHGQGKHSEFFPVIKSYVRHWLEESEFARQYVETYFRGEVGSPYTRPNPGETVVLFKGTEQSSGRNEELSWEEEEEEWARKQAKRRRAEELRTKRRRSPRR